MNKRILQTLRLWSIPGSAGRTNYLKKHNIFGTIGEHCSIMDRKIPLYANLIRIGNNVHIASKVDFITHDIVHVMLNNALNVVGGVQEYVDCIEIGNNVFIGSNTTILAGVHIGNNVIIGACSLIVEDIPDDSVAVGFPARVIGNFEDFCQKRINMDRYPCQPVIGQYIPNELQDWLWNRFYEERK